jgi:hypothetical protein
MTWSDLFPLVTASPLLKRDKEEPRKREERNGEQPTVGVEFFTFLKEPLHPLPGVGGP